MEGLEELTLELCSTCPQQCLHCSSNSCPASRDRLDAAHSIRLIHEAAVLGTRKLSLGGGEPLLSAQLEHVLEEASRLGMQTEIFTCGIATLPPRLNPIPTRLLSDWSKLPRLKVIFSVQGAFEHTHDHITQTKGSYRTLLTSLDACLHAGIPSEINFVPLKPNVGEFTHLIDLASRLGVNQVSVLRFVAQGRGATNRVELELSWEEENAFVQELVRLREYRSVAIRTGSPFNGIVPGNHVACRAGAEKLVVQADGNVLPCEVFKHQERCQWHLNIYEESLREILQSASLARLRKTLRMSDCLKCPVHGSLRNQQRSEGEHERVPESAVHTA